MADRKAGLSVRKIVGGQRWVGMFFGSVVFNLARKVARARGLFNMIAPKSPYHYPNEPARFTARDVDPLLVFCVEHNVSDITIQTDEQVFIEVYGKLHRITNRRLTPGELNEIVTSLYASESGIAKLNGGSDLDFAHEIRPDRERRLRFRVNATGISVQGHTGVQITIRTIPGVPKSILELGVEDEILSNFAPKQGLVLITGATGSGKSTLLAGGIRWLAEDPNSNRKILTYESPIEFVYDEVEKPSTIICQTEIGRQLPTFAAGVRNALRRKPMIILVGEARDAETIGECVTASMTGHLTYSTVHSNGFADTIRRMVNVFPDGEKHARAIDIIASLKMIVSQMLIPSTDGKRVALREYVVFNDSIVDRMLTAGVDNLTMISRQIVKEEGQSFLKDATNKFNEGRIDKFELAKIQALSKGADRDGEEASGIRRVKEQAIVQVPSSFVSEETRKAAAPAPVTSPAKAAHGSQDDVQATAVKAAHGPQEEKSALLTRDSEPKVDKSVKTDTKTGAVSADEEETGKTGKKTGGAAGRASGGLGKEYVRRR